MHSTRGKTEMFAIRDLHVEIVRPAGVRPVIRGVSLRVAPGECVALVGESAAGKSLTLLASLGLAPAAARVRGSLEVDGRTFELARTAELGSLRGRTASLLFQNASGSLTPHLTIRRQLTGVIRRHQDLGAFAAASEAQRLLDAVQLPDADRRLQCYPHELSGGMRQRAALALALASRPRYLLADEPTTALDATLQLELLQLLRGLVQDTGLGLLLVTHDFGAVAGIAQRIAVMYAGRKVEEGTAESVLAGPAHPYTAALLASRPRLDAPLAGPLVTIPGLPPAAGDWPAGCAFASRCPRALEVCRQVDPPESIGPGGASVACHAPLAGLAT